MIVTLKDVLQNAKKEHYGVGLFNTVNLEMAKGVLAAAEEAKSPVIIGTAEVLLPYASLEELAYFLVPMAKKASVPVVLHFDHGLTEPAIEQAIGLGFSSIMYDCSTRSYEENIAAVKHMTDFAHHWGVTVEGELGHVGNNAVEADGDIYTDPQQAADYANRTGVDALAVAIGTSHGAYKSTPRLDFDRLKQIASATEVPLVLHGGSGLSDDDFRRTIADGIAKVNIFTDINNAAAKAAHDNYHDGLGLTDIMLSMADAVKAETLKKMKLFGSVGKA